MGLLPRYVQPTADSLREAVQNIRRGAAEQGVDLSEFTDLDVLAIGQWCSKNATSELDAAYTMLGLIAHIGLKT
jgi:hypothetical protein